MTGSPAFPGDEAFTQRLIRRKKLFLALAIAGVSIAALLSTYYVWRKWHDPEFQIGARAVIVVLVLLNARQNLRQYKCARIVARLTGAGS